MTTEIKDQSTWDSFITAHGSQFLQSWDWSELQKSLKRKIWRLGILEQNQLVAAALIIKMPLPFGKNYLYSPRGPVLPLPEGEMSERSEDRGGGSEEKYFNQIIKEIIKIAQLEKSIFYRLEPIHQITNIKYQITNSVPVQPQKTMILDLGLTEDELLTNFHQKTRYNIRLAEKKGVTIRKGKTDADFEIFWNLLVKTYTKQKISAHPKKYYKKILDTKYQILDTKLYLAEHQGKPLAANLVHYYGTTATYNHGGSDYQYRHLMAPHLLQWQQIKDAKKTGLDFYDFRGIDAQRWPGVTRFKKGFGGVEVNYPGTFDLPLSKLWYSLYKLGRQIKP